VWLRNCGRINDLDVRPIEPPEHGGRRVCRVEGAKLKRSLSASYTLRPAAAAAAAPWIRSGSSHPESQGLGCPVPFFPTTTSVYEAAC
jgi:hypothetical protein